MTIEAKIVTRTSSQDLPDGRFIPPGEPADVTVQVVTYNNETEIGELIESLRHEAKALRLRVIVADNDSSDKTIEVLARHADVSVVSTGGNLGYAAGINTASKLTGVTDAVLVLNPDLRIEPGAITTLVERMRASKAGIVVPRLLEADGSFYASLRREPSFTTALFDAFFGARLANRPGWMSESVYDPTAYEDAHRIEWATGAALLIRGDLAEQLGDWDQRFFLYSEEVDFFRRARAAGEDIWYEPASRMIHVGGASGASAQLEALMAVNRIRYVRKYHRAGYSRWYRHAVVLREALRSYKSKNRQVFSLIVDESRWELLPGPSATVNLGRVLESFPQGSIIVPAHNEAAVIARTLASLAPVVSTGAVEVIVACNGCTDETVEIAREFHGVMVIEVSQASKTAALNAADKVATHWPRLYLDADIEITPTAVRMVFENLQGNQLLAARPASRYDDAGASSLVKAFYRARRRLSTTDNALWGAGAYAISQVGHKRFGQFPHLTGDDHFADLQFEASEKAVLNTPPVRVITPRDTKSLLAILRRNYRGDAELEAARRVEQVVTHSTGTATKETARELLTSVTGPRSILDAIVYSGLVLTARLHYRLSKRQPRWERDESSRRDRA